MVQIQTWNLPKSMGILLKHYTCEELEGEFFQHNLLESILQFDRDNHIDKHKLHEYSIINNKFTRVTIQSLDIFKAVYNKIIKTDFLTCKFG